MMKSESMTKYESPNELGSPQSIPMKRDEAVVCGEDVFSRRLLPRLLQGFVLSRLLSARPGDGGWFAVEFQAVEEADELSFGRGAGPLVEELAGFTDGFVLCL